MLITILSKGFINCFKELIKLRLMRVDYRTKRDEKKNSGEASSISKDI